MKKLKTKQTGKEKENERTSNLTLPPFPFPVFYLLH